jgi:hypothetical protein
LINFDILVYRVKMKKQFYLLIVLLIALSCKNNDNLQVHGEKKISRQAVTAAEGYAKGHLKNSSRWVTDQGIIVISDSISKFLIDPSKIVTGDFEGDSLKDAIIPLYLFRGKEQDITINLFLVNNEGNLMTVRAIQDNMKVLSVMNRVIYIELPAVNQEGKKPGTPARKEVKEFLFEGDSLRRYASSSDTIR